MTNKIPLPKPLFDTLENISDSSTQAVLYLADYRHAISFLKSYKGSTGTFNSYRREIERLLQWSWLVAKKSAKDLRRADIESYIAFCQSPLLEWIGTKKAPRFIEKNGKRLPNPEWRPFVVTVSKSAHRKGKKNQKLKAMNFPLLLYKICSPLRAVFIIF